MAAAHPGRDLWIGRRGPAESAALDQDRIAELVRAIVARAQLVVGAAQRRVVCERSQQLGVAGARLVRAGEDRLDDAQAGRRAAPPPRPPPPRPHPARPARPPPARPGPPHVAASSRARTPVVPPATPPPPRACPPRIATAVAGGMR